MLNNWFHHLYQFYVKWPSYVLWELKFCINEQKIVIIIDWLIHTLYFSTCSIIHLSSLSLDSWKNPLYTYIFKPSVPIYTCSLPPGIPWARACRNPGILEFQIDTMFANNSGHVLKLRPIVWRLSENMAKLPENVTSCTIPQAYNPVYQFNTWRESIRTSSYVCLILQIFIRIGVKSSVWQLSRILSSIPVLQSLSINLSVLSVLSIYICIYLLI